MAFPFHPCKEILHKCESWSQVDFNDFETSFYIWSFYRSILYYTDTDEIPGFFLLIKSRILITQWRYYFYLSHVRILVLSWLLTWLANYKRASCSGTLPVLLKFHSQNGFKMQRRYSYQWLSMSCQIFTSKFFKHVERLGRFAEVSESDVELWLKFSKKSFWWKSTMKSEK